MKQVKQVKQMNSIHLVFRWMSVAIQSQSAMQIGSNKGLCAEVAWLFYSECITYDSGDVWQDYVGVFQTNDCTDKSTTVKVIFFVYFVNYWPFADINFVKYRVSAAVVVF